MIQVRQDSAHWSKMWLQKCRRGHSQISTLPPACSQSSLLAIGSAFTLQLHHTSEPGRKITPGSTVKWTRKANVPCLWQQLSAQSSPVLQAKPNNFESLQIRYSHASKTSLQSAFLLSQVWESKPLTTCFAGGGDGATPGSGPALELATSQHFCHLPHQFAVPIMKKAQGGMTFRQWSI